MSDHESGKKSVLTASGRARRRFLERTAFAAAGTSAAAALPGMAVAASKATAPALPVNCPEVKTPMKDVAGKVAFITGGSSGIGLGIARAFAEAGMKVVFTYRTPSHRDEAMAALAGARTAAHAIQVDVTDRAGLEKAAAEAVKVFGKVHVLVNNAGVALPPSLSATSYADWDWTLNVNLNGPFNGVHTFLPLIQSHGEGGQIITTSSMMGLIAAAGGAAYTASKYAVVGMMEALRAELAGSNIGVSVFCPGYVNSNITVSSYRDRPAGSAVKDDPEFVKRDTQARNNPELAMDPREAGQFVLRGLRNNDLYIFSHPEYENLLIARHEALVSSLPREVPLTEARAKTARSDFKSSIYGIERDRQRCAQAKRAKAKV